MTYSDQKVWFIVGASKGLGFELAKAALHAGDAVTATIKDKKDSILGKIGNNSRLLELQMDITNEKQVKIAVRKAVNHYRHLDVVVNGAACRVVSAIEEATNSEVREQYDVNVFGVLNVLRATLPYLRKQLSGHIINVSSLFAFNAVPGWGLYASTKSAVEGLSTGLCKELAPFGIKVTVVEPGLFTTSTASGRSTRIACNPISEYNKTMVGYVKKQAIRSHGDEPGDPSKLAAVMIMLSRAEKAPLHLPIGADAIASYEIKANQLAKDINEWRNITMQTGHQH